MCFSVFSAKRKKRRILLESGHKDLDSCEELFCLISMFLYECGLPSPREFRWSLRYARGSASRGLCSYWNSSTIRSQHFCRVRNGRLTPQLNICLTLFLERTTESIHLKCINKKRFSVFWALHVPNKDRSKLAVAF